MFSRIKLNSIGILFLVAAAISLMAACQDFQPIPTPALEGELHFIDSSGQPLAKTTIRILCFASESTESFVQESTVVTDATGKPAITLPDKCNYLAALAVLNDADVYKSGKPERGADFEQVIEVYATSWEPGDPTPLSAAKGAVAIRSDWPLALFNVIAAIEWQPGPKDGFVTELESGLYEASRYLYDLTDGQMAFGRVDIRSGGHDWDSADFRFKTANDHRPAAFIGGIVNQTTEYKAINPAITPPNYVGEAMFQPGEILLGRYWNGRTAADATGGAWRMPDAFRTLVHEWAHYALFLGDEYRQSSTGDMLYCLCQDLDAVGALSKPSICAGFTDSSAASAMAYHYTSSEFWHDGEHGVWPQCLGSDQIALHGDADWQTLVRWHKILGLDTAIQDPGILQANTDFTVAGHLFQPASPLSHIPDPAYDKQRVHLVIEDKLTEKEARSVYPQVYTLAGDPEKPDDVQYQGTTTCDCQPRDTTRGTSLGSIDLYGISNDHVARAYADVYGPKGSRYIYLGDSALHTGDVLPLVPTSWPVSLDISLPCANEKEGFNTILATLTGHNSDSEPLIQICSPDAAVGCSALQPMQRNGDAWVKKLTAPDGGQLPHYGYIRVASPRERDGELIRWYQKQGGVGPADMWGDAPLRDGMVMVDTTEHMPGAQNQVLIMPAARFEALTLPDGIAGVIGAPFDIDVVQPLLDNDAICLSTTIGEEKLPHEMVFSFFFDQQALENLDVKPEQLVLFQYAPGEESRWREIESFAPAPNRQLDAEFLKTMQDKMTDDQKAQLEKEQRFSPDQPSLLNWISSAPINQDGIFLVGYRD